MFGSEWLQAVLKWQGPQRFLPMSRFGTSQARDTPVAALVPKSERLPPNIMVVPSISMHPPPTLAGRPTGKAVLALLVRSRRLHGHAPRGRGRVLDGDSRGKS